MHRSIIKLRGVYKPKKDYKVIVKTITFNQSMYIQDTLNGIAMQNTSFPFVNVVLEDNSTDGEQNVIRLWIERECDMSNAEYYDIPTAYIVIAPHRINHNCTFAVYFHKENLFCQKEKREEQVNAWRERCKYEALCEGDDYWIDPLKLQKQADFLDENPDYGLVYAKTKIYDQNDNKFEQFTIGKEATSFDDLIRLNSIPTLTVCFRIELCNNYHKAVNINPSWKMGDYPMWLFISLNSKIKFVDEITAVYRKLEQSASHHTDINGKLAFLESSSDICSYFLTYANRWDLKKVYKAKYCDIIMNYYISYNLPVKFSMISKYWLWKPKFVVKYLLSQLKLTRRILYNC